MPEVAATPLADALRAAPPDRRAEMLSEHLRREISDRLGVETLGLRDAFMDAGLDSLKATELKFALEGQLGLELKASLAFDHPTIETLTQFLLQELGLLRRDPLQEAQQTIAELRRKLETLSGREDPIAIVGMSCRFPGGIESPEQYWRVLSEGIDVISVVPSDRWNADEWYDPSGSQASKMRTREGGFVEGVHAFDAKFFRISPREAKFMDPQHRLLLEATWHALENAAIDPDSLYGSDGGVFIGMTTSDYGGLVHAMLPEWEMDPFIGTGVAHSPAAGRIAYVLGLHGPALVVDTACSASLVALHQGATALRMGECDLALVGGVNLVLAPSNNAVLSSANMLSADGRCKTFDDTADGYGRSEGVGMIVIKRLSDAKRDGNRILALVRGSAINQDGASGGLTVPSGPAQVKVIRQALANAGLAPADVSYVEAHGTGTALGDPIEMNALGEVYKGSHTEDAPLLVGSSKTNVGHMEAAAGMGSLIKVLLQFEHERLAPHLHLTRPSQRIRWSELPVKVVQAPTPWQRNEGKPRIAGVSSFGYSGTNGHVILQEPPPRDDHSAETRGTSRPLQLLTISAKSPRAATRLAAAYSERLAQSSQASFADICYSAATGRAHLPYRIAVVASDAPAMIEKLKSAKAVTCQPDNAPRVGFLFTGQGSQMPGMARSLYEQQPDFRADITLCDRLLQPHTGWSLVDVLYGGANESVHQTGYAQPLLFALEYSLARLWQRWGVTPTALLGHSVGEYVAACLADVFSLEDGLRLIAARGRLMQALPSGGGMLAVGIDEAQAREIIAPFANEVAIAAINGPLQIVLSGVNDRLVALASELKNRRIEAKALTVSHAFHSHLMEPMLAEFARIAEQTTYSAPTRAVISNISGTRVGNEIASARYWVEHIRAPVRFAEGLAAMHTAGCSAFLEIGPHAVLTGMGRRCLDNTALTWLTSLRQGQDDWVEMLNSLAELYLRGVRIDWRAFYAHEARQKCALPLYPFERERHWPVSIDLTRPYNRQVASTHPLLGQQRHTSDGHIAFETPLADNAPEYLRDHRVFASTIFPAAGFVEMALAAGVAVLGTDRLQVLQLEVRSPLQLPPAERMWVRTTLASKDGQHIVRMSSRAEDEGDDDWKLLAQCRITSDPTTDGLPELIVSRTAPTGAVPRDLARLYQQLRTQRGLDYGPAFRGLTNIAGTELSAMSEVALPEAAGSDHDYLLHPALLDAALQTIAAIASGDDPSSTYLPAAFERIEVRKKPSGRLTVRCESYATPAPNPPVRTLDLLITDATGTAVVTISRLQCLRTDLAALRRGIYGDPSKTLFERRFDRRPLATSVQLAPDAARGHWLLFADRGGMAERVAEAIGRHGGKATLLRRGEVQDLRSVLGQVTDARGILYFWGLDIGKEETGAALAADPSLGCNDFLEVLQAVTATRALAASALCLVTRGVFAVDPRRDRVRPEAGPLAGMFRVAHLELPSHPNVHLDLDPTPDRTPAHIEQQQILRELVALVANPSQTDPTVACRAGLRYVVRFARQPDTAAQLPTSPSQLVIEEYGSLDHIKLKPLKRRAPAAGEVEIEVRAAALNFKDVLLALGLLKKHALDHHLPWTDRYTMGFECAGVVSAVGDGVKDLAPGDKVLAWGWDCMTTHLTLPAANVVHKPERVSFADAAALPTVFLTAYHALFNLAKIKRGDKVLVHAAAGGVGQAVIRLCKKVGAEVLATASPAKWDFLHCQGVSCVMSSRSLDFAAQVMAHTGGQGVDIVVNSLAGEFIDASFSVLRKGGAFVEIGKLGVHSTEQVAAARPDVSYYAFDMAELPSEARVIWGMIQEIVGWLAEGIVEPLPLDVFPASEAVAAFRHLAQAANIGKVVLEFSADPPPPMAPFRSDATYLVTGGLGGLGLRLARWLTEQGAQNLLLTGRRAPSPDAQREIEALRGGGAHIEVVTADVVNKADVNRLLARIGEMKPPQLAGVFHAAGVLDDGLLIEQTTERYAKVLAPKLHGTWNLHSATLGRSLDYFVCFSSITAVVGAVGQSNYSAANSFMDGLMLMRSHDRLPGVAIGWGPWAEVGMAAKLDRQVSRQIRRRGILPLRPVLASSAMQDILRRGSGHLVCASIDVPRFVASTVGTSAKLLEPLVVELSRATSAGAQGSSFRARLNDAKPEERRALLSHWVQETLAQVLGFASADRIEPDQKFTELGIDSLATVEFKNRLEAGLGCSVPTTLAFDHPTIAAASAFLHDHVLGWK